MIWYKQFNRSDCDTVIEVSYFEPIVVIALTPSSRKLEWPTGHAYSAGQLHIGDLYSLIDHFGHMDVIQNDWAWSNVSER